MLSKTLVASSFLFFSSQVVRSAPLFGLDLDLGLDIDLTPDTSAGATTAVSASTVLSDLLRPAQFSRVSYCSGPAVTSWTCGAPCDELGQVKILQTGGDDGLVPVYYIAHDIGANTIVVTHQGTERGSFASVLNSAEFLLTDIDTVRFPAAENKDIEVHAGFQRTFDRTADGILTGVQDALATTGAKKVLITGHSLGGAIGLFDAMMLRERLDASIEIKTVVFGTPRCGNDEWAKFVDATLGNTLSLVTNQNDIVPTVPPLALGFKHPSGEIHINAVDAAGDATDIVSCSGQENEKCSAGNSLLDVSISNHRGPYFLNVSFGSSACPL